MEGAEFRIPDSELEGSLELRVPSPQPARLVPMPSDKILFPRRMLYVQAVILLLVAVAAFGLGYLSGRGGDATPGDLSGNRTDRAAAQKRVPVEGKVLLDAGSGKTSGDAGAVVIVLPSAKTPSPRLPSQGLGPADPPLSPDDRTAKLLGEFGGATARIDSGGDFSLFVPESGAYRVLIVSHKATRAADVPIDQADLALLGNYFEKPADLLRSYKYRLMKLDLHMGAAPIDVEFRE